MCTNGFCSPAVGKKSSSIEYTGTFQGYIICPQIPHFTLPGHGGISFTRWPFRHRESNNSSREVCWTEAYDELWVWLTDALKQLGDMEPITGPGPRCCCSTALQTQGNNDTYCGL